ncbi:HTTM domain-containing protein [Rosistilla oblonga]|uniref:HTTM domain-containing protein n=1 Tax=Rosistilla oblonga TaxID=2527990 RepID=UPI003A9739DD
MNKPRRWIASYFAELTTLWDRFWFTPTAPHTLAAIRIAIGLMLLYTHLVLASQLLAFVGTDAWVTTDTVRQLHENDYAWSYLWYVDSPAILWTHHLVTIAVTICFACGIFTRLTAPAAWFLQLMYMHRLTGALFGLDQMTTMITMYLMLTPCGSVWSVDAWLRRRRDAAGRPSRWWLPSASPSIAANIGTRLLQLHLCVIYLFGGVSKMRGEMWWDGTATWFAVSNYEYQSMDMTWIVHYPILFAALSHATVLWETFYCALVWPRLTRPWVLLTAVMVHGGIAMFLGMITFGVTMIIANAIFIPPAILQTLCRRQPKA